MQDLEIKDELSKDEKEKHNLVKKPLPDMRLLSMRGFFISVISYVYIVLLNLINNYLLLFGGMRGNQIYNQFSKLSTAFKHIALCVGIAGFVVSIIAYKNSEKDDVKSKKLSAVGISFGALQVWQLLYIVLFAISRAIISIK